MPIAHARREEMQELSRVHGGANTILFKSLFDKDAFQTPWFFIHAAILLPGGGIGHHRHDDSEEIFVTVDNAAQFTHNGRTAEIAGGASVPARAGESHAVYNHTGQETRWYNFHVVDPEGQPKSTDLDDDCVGAPLESTDRLPVGRFDRSLLEYNRSHQGKGAVGSRQIWEARDFRTNFGSLAHALLPPGASVGYHRHDTIEECYVIMEGSGRMTVDDETIEVVPGDVILNRLGGSHGIYNHARDELEFFAVAVCGEKGSFDSTELDDDLTQR